MSGLKFLGVFVATVSIVAIGSAQGNPFLGRDEFPQFRQSSGMSGSGYGLDPDGWGSLSGATAFSTPLGIALGHDQGRVFGGQTAFSFNHLFNGFEGSNRATGKASFEFGHSFGNFNLAYSYFVKSFFGDASTDLQLSYARDFKSPSFSVGVQDIGGHGGAAGTGFSGDKDLSRSIFGAVTVPLLTGKNPDQAPVYVSAGWGSRRFDKGFASGSYQFLNWARIWTEYDGFGFNEGVLLGYRAANRNEEGEGQHGFEADLLLGLIRGRYPTAGITLGF